jgi:hypothetical protein
MKLPPLPAKQAAGIRTGSGTIVSVKPITITSLRAAADAGNSFCRLSPHNIKANFKIWGLYGGDYEECRLLACDSMWLL